MERGASNPGQSYPVPGRQPQLEVTVHNITPEELKVYKDCVSSGYYKTGIPFAVLIHLIANRKKTAGPSPGGLLKSGFLFLGNVLLGSLFYTPFCYYKLAHLRAEAAKRAKELDLHGTPFVPEETQSKSQVADDYSYPIDLITNLSEPDSNYSADIDSSRLVHDDDKDNKTKSMTYDDLRAKHRSRYTGYTPPPSSLSYEPDLSLYSSPSDKETSSEKPSSAPPPRKVVRNKYGDEFE